MSRTNDQLKKDLEEKEKQNWTKIGTKEEFVGLKKDNEYLKNGEPTDTYSMFLHFFDASYDLPVIGVSFLREG